MCNVDFNLNSMVEEITKEIALDFEDKKDGFFMLLWQNFKTGLLGTLYVMANDTKITFKVNLIGMTIDFMQLLAFPLSKSSEFPWNHDYSWWLQEILWYARLEFYISDTNALMNIIVYWILMMAVFLNLTNAAYVGWNFYKQRE
jgi:hypothetical protein